MTNSNSPIGHIVHKIDCASFQSIMHTASLQDNLLRGATAAQSPSLSLCGKLLMDGRIRWREGRKIVGRRERRKEGEREGARWSGRYAAKNSG